MDPKQKAALESVTRVYSVVTVKELDDEKREFSGIASTPSTDRHGDIVEPMGAEFSLPIALLWQHDHYMPVGTVTFAKAGKGGIEVRGSIPKVSAPAGLAARLEEAWQSLKHGLVRGLSVGFQPLEYAFMDNGGIHFTKWAWHELSLVTIPANADATITAIKQFDSQALAAIGQKGKGVEGKTTSGATEKAKTQVKRAPEGKKMNIQEQIKSFEKTRQLKADRMAELMAKAAEEGVTLDAEQTEEYDTLAAEVKSVDEHLKRLQVMEEANKAKATAVPATPNAERISVPAVAKAPMAEKGLALAQVAKFLGRAQGNRHEALEMAKQAANNSGNRLDPRVVGVLKAAVAVGSTGNAAWAGNLVGDETSVYADFVEYLRPQTIIGKFGDGNVPGLRTVPFRTPLISQTTGGAGYWVGEGNAKPVTKFDFDRTTLEPLKVANIAVVTEEILRDSSPSADAIIRDQLVAALRERLDIDFIDPAKGAVSNVSPASITNGAPNTGSSGVDATAVRADIRALFDSFIAANNTPRSGVLVMSATTALALSLMQNPLGQSEFPGMSMNGGVLLGIPVIVSEYITADSSGHYVVMVNAGDIYVGDEGGFAVDISREASIQMNDSPDNPTTASTVMVSLWQRNLVGFRAERTISWARRRTSAVSYLTGVNWGA
jgi:HK97 family phage major capsid protein/HK97 family phage prohead protease